MLRIWNSLPEDVVSAAHLSLFISRLVRVNLKSVSDRQKVDAFMCCFYISWISGSTLLTVGLYLYLVTFYLVAFKRHYALRLAIAPGFFYCSYICIFYVCSGLLK